MKVEKEIWQERMNNLILRRQTGGSSNSPSKIGDYASHLSKVFVGRSVLDVGCGSMAVKNHLAEGVKYTGIDALPISADVVKTSIEECDFDSNSYDTVIVFAALDNFYDLEKAFSNIKRIAKHNVVFLTGVDIEVDQYHTFKITNDLLIKGMADFKVGYYEELSSNVILIEFIK